MFYFLLCKLYPIVSNIQISIKIMLTHGGTRTPNLRFRRPTPYPLGHAGTTRGVKIDQSPNAQEHFGANINKLAAFIWKFYGQDIVQPG